MSRFRKKVSKFRSKRRFSRTADRVHRKNRSRSPMRGGYRL